jgi:hypothetical protein
VQDRYAGDVGDFVKLGLLRHLAAEPVAGGARLEVGLNWYLAPDEAHNADGKHIAYLAPSSRYHSSLARCDPELIRCLARVVATGRSVEALEQSGALPAGTPTHRERLTRAQDPATRRAWHSRALDSLADVDVVLADPDNGLASSAVTPRLHKYTLVAELADYAHRGQSLIAYQHAGRSASAIAQAHDRLGQLSSAVGQAPAGAIIVHRGSCRFFLVTSTEPHCQQLTDGLRVFVAKWAPHVEFVEPYRSAPPQPQAPLGSVARPRRTPPSAAREAAVRSPCGGST